MHDSYQGLWLALLVGIAGLEAVGLLRKKRGDTLSEYTWLKTRKPVMRGALGGLLGWLVYHWLFAGPHNGTGSVDLIAAGAGIVAGLIAAKVRR